jgi:hypothetical protein
MALRFGPTFCSIPEILKIHRIIDPRKKGKIEEGIHGKNASTKVGKRSIGHD